MDDESIRDDLFRPSADARIFMRITINMRRKCAIENTGREVLESELESNNYHSKKMRNGKDRKRSAGIKLALEVKGAVCCANPWAKARVLEKKLYQSVLESPHDGCFTVFIRLLFTLTNLFKSYF